MIHHHVSLQVFEVSGGDKDSVCLSVTQLTKPSPRTSLLALLPPSTSLASLASTVSRLRSGHPSCKMLLLCPNISNLAEAVNSMGLSKQGEEGNTTLLSDMKTEEVRVSSVDLGSVEAMQVTTASTYCPVCGTWSADLVEMTKHKESMKHRRNRLFHVYQHDKEKMLKNPHPLGLEVKIAEQEQGVVHSPVEGQVTVTSGPSQPKTFQLVLTNTREGDLEEEKEDGKPGQIGIVVEQVGVMRLDSVFQLSDDHGVTKDLESGEKAKKIRLRTGKRYKINVRASASQVGVYRVPLLVAFYHDTASAKVEGVTARGEEARSIMSHLAIELLLKVQTGEMSSLAPSKPFSQPKRVQNWGPGRDMVRVQVPVDLQVDKSEDRLRKTKTLDHYNITPARKRMLATNFQKAESKEEKDEVARCRKLLESPLTWENYKQRWSLLLHAEEQQLETDIRHYDMGGVSMRQLPSRRLFELKVPGLEENRPSVMKGDKICVKLGQVTYEGHVNQIKEDKVELLFHEKFIKQYMKGIKLDVRFTISRFPVRNMHRAVEVASEPSLPLLPLLFPKEDQLVPSSAALPSIRCKNRKIEENAQQLLAVQHIVAGSSGSAPYLVFGPPGTGKTVTVVEAIKQVYELEPNSQILATAPSNAAADLLAERLKEHIQKRHILRVHAASRSISTIPESILGISNVDQGRFTFPTMEEMSKIRILVTTLVSAGRLVSASFPTGHFTHIFIDEAGQATEPELAIPLSLVVPGKGQVVMVGDPRQLGPVIRSNLGSRNGLSTSLLERLMEKIPLYARKDGAYDPRCITKLVRNFRSHPSLLEVPASLFYHSELQPCADPVVVNSCLQFSGLSEAARGKIPLIFRGIIGQDLKEESSPSFFNVEEAVTVLEYVKEITSMRENRVAAKDIGVIAPYRRQVQKIRKKLKEHNFADVTVGSTEEFQGQERKVIIVSTVRSTPEYVNTDTQYKLGFLSNPKRFNVAITRAKALLIIVGNPHILSQDKDWAALLAYAREKGCYTGCPYDQESDADLDRLEAKLKGLLLRGRGDEVTWLTQLEEPAWRTDM